VPTPSAKLFYYLRALTAAVLSVAFGVASLRFGTQGSTAFYVLLVSIAFAAYACYCLLAAGYQDAE
jgi:hypothetical protein